MTDVPKSKIAGDGMKPWILALALTVPTWPSDLLLHDVPAQVYFSPRGGCTEAVVAAITSAQKTVLVQAYSFTSAPIAGALKAAHDRGVDVRVILDKSQETERYSGLTYLEHAGVPVFVDRAHSIAHNKVMVIDGETVITGSFNFTKAAEEHNAENLLVLHDAGLARIYTQNWQSHSAHSDSAASN
jgi:phosphatidylserine/phosphatidylglycerophosphate/cardiolipin synthase-like enzyme